VPIGPVTHVTAEDLACTPDHKASKGPEGGQAEMLHKDMQQIQVRAMNLEYARSGQASQQSGCSAGSPR